LLMPVASIVDEFVGARAYACAATLDALVRDASPVGAAMIRIDPAARQAGIGTRLLAALTDALRQTGVRKLRTLLSHDNTLILSFFRSQGMMAAPLIPLEMDVAP